MWVCVECVCVSVCITSTVFFLHTRGAFRMLNLAMILQKKRFFEVLCVRRGMRGVGGAEHKLRKGKNARLFILPQIFMFVFLAFLHEHFSSAAFFPADVSLFYFSSPGGNFPFH